MLSWLIVKYFSWKALDAISSRIKHFFRNDKRKKKGTRERERERGGMDEEKNAIIPRAIVNCAFARKSYPCAGKTWKKIVAFVRGGRLGGIENGSLVKRKR